MGGFLWNLCYVGFPRDKANFFQLLATFLVEPYCTFCLAVHSFLSEDPEVGDLAN